MSCYMQHEASEKCFLMDLKTHTVKHCEIVLHISIRTVLLHLLNNLTKRLDLQCNNLMCLNISASLLLLLLNICPKYLIKSVYEISIELKC